MKEAIALVSEDGAGDRILSACVIPQLSFTKTQKDCGSTDQEAFSIMTPECLEITRKKHKQIDQIVLSNICNILDSFAQPFDKTESLLENILSTETIQKEWKQLIHMWIDYLMENELVKEEQGVYRRTSA